MKKALNDLKAQIEAIVKAHCYKFDPCEYCKKRNRDDDENYKECLKCCYYYGSNFEVDDGIKNHSED